MKAENDKDIYLVFEYMGKYRLLFLIKRGYAYHKKRVGAYGSME